MIPEWIDYADDDPRIVAMHFGIENHHQCVSEGLMCQDCLMDAKLALAALEQRGFKVE